MLGDTHAVRDAVAAVVAGRVVAHGFGNFYALSCRPDGPAVRAMNRLKGRPEDQVGSITAPPSRIAALFDWTRLPDGVTRQQLLSLADLLYGIGPFGLRGPAATGLPDHLTTVQDGVRTVQLIAPGYACPSNGFLAEALAATGGDFLAITSANRSRRMTGTAEEPAHWQLAPLRAEFDSHPEMVFLPHQDEPAARRAHPRHRPMSTTVLAFHYTAPASSGRPRLTVERQGSLPLPDLREAADRAGFTIALSPHARTVTERRYPVVLG
ncbi:hypothetical protein AB0K51_06735 [Kitasatospora sp. NPDC049285]|uniref:hypothetical protein n=1 Tax=Kitasatospora sp. NPDC049285 TaxID=3157096 RepID=UPI00341DBAF0